MWAETGLTAGEITGIIAAVSTAAVVIIGAVVTGIVTILNFRRQRDDEIGLKKAYAEIASEIQKAYLKNENRHRAQAGKELIVLPAAVVAEGNSPPDEKQLETANLATMRATSALLLLQTGMPARKEPNGHDIATAPLVEVLDTIKIDAKALAEKAEAAKLLAGKVELPAPAKPASDEQDKSVDEKVVEVEQKTVEEVGEEIGEQVVKAAERKIIKQVKVTEDEIIDHMDKGKKKTTH